MSWKNIAVLLTIALVLSLFGTTSVEAKKPTPPPEPTATPTPDIAPPNTVSNLEVAATTHQSITFTWTATGDDGSEGQASTYDVRYALDGPMSEAKWDAEPLNRASALTDPYGVPHPDKVVYPAESGEDESVEFAGLAAGTTYYFGIKACDEAGNCSPVAAADGATTLSAGAGEWAIDIVNEEAWIDKGHRKDVDVLENGQIGLWYADEGDFYHSYRPGGSDWQDEVVSSGADDQCLAFAYSPSGVPWASTCVNGPLQVMYKDAYGSWVTETVDGDPAIGPVSLVHPPGSEEPALSFRRGNPSYGDGSVWFAWRDSGTWYSEEVDGGIPGAGGRLAFHPSEGYPSIAYAAVWADLYEIRFAEKIGASWSTELVLLDESAGISAPLDLAYHPGEHYPAIAHKGSYNEGVHYTYRTPSGWTEPQYVDAVEASETGGYDYNYGGLVLAFGGDGTVYVGFQGSAYYKVYRFFANDGTGWQLVHSDSVIPAETASLIRDDASVNPVNGLPVFTYGWDPIRIVERIPPAPGVSVGPTEGLVTTEEGNGTDTFAVRLDTEPDANVTIDLSSSDTSEGTVSTTMLTFTPANWNTVQVVTVTGVDESIFDGDVEYSIITADTQSTDSDYDGLDVDDISVTNLDDDPPPVHVYESSDVPKAIPDDGTVESTLTVADSFSILDLNVRLSIAHTRDTDLDVYLVAPDNTRIELFTDVGSVGDDFDGTVLDDEAAQSIADGSAPFAGIYRPEGSLGDLDGLSVYGTWTLEITDDKARETGSLLSWSLDMTEG